MALWRSGVQLPSGPEIQLKIKNEELKMEENAAKVEKVDLLDRTLEYSLRTIRLYQQLKNDEAGRTIGKQLLRSATSVGANFHEAQGGQSKADFLAKISISYKEARETLYWLLVIKRANLLRTQEVDTLIDETGQLIKILSSIILSSKQNSSSALSPANS